MHCTKRVLDDLLWVGADDRRLTCFEGVYGVPDGVSYNSYLLLDEKTVLFDTVDKAVARTFFDNVAYGLDGRKLDYLVIHHMEPDHAATIEDLIYRYPDTTIVCTEKVKSSNHPRVRGMRRHDVTVFSRNGGSVPPCSFLSRRGSV